MYKVIILALVIGIIGGMGEAFAQTATIGTSSTSYNGTQQVLPVFIPSNQQEQQTDQTGLYGIISLIVTGIALPIVTKVLKDKDEKTKEEARAENDENVFRLKATASALKAQSQSLEETDKAAYQLSLIVKGMINVFSKKDELKALFNEEKIDGIGLVDYVNKFVAESENDLEDYYKNNNLPVDDFDTCKDTIVQQLAAVRNKSRKLT